MLHSSLRWTAATRARLHHFRTKHPKDPKGAHALPAPGDAWATIRARTAAGRASATPKLQDALARLQREFAADAPPPFDAAFALFRLAYVVGHCRIDRDLLAHRDWAPEREVVAMFASAGASELLRTLTAGALAPSESPATDIPFWLETASEWRDEVTTLVVTLSEAPPSQFALAPPAFCVASAQSVVERGVWWAFRMFIDTLDERAFSAANEDARRIRRALATTAHRERSQIALAFARDPTHADEERANAAADTSYAGVDLCRVVLASRTLEACEPLLDRAMAPNEGDLSDIAFDLVESFGASAAPVLARALASLRGREMNSNLRRAIEKPFVGALALLE
ncbi:MAG: hypothetical protein JNK05_31905 [Myxococcales bacterium]|nr:hypothetical protein [Myxococcales bacterium]